MFKKDTESTVRAPNPRLGCSSDLVEELGPSVCSGALNSGKLYVACCSEDFCNEKERYTPVYVDPVTTETTFTTPPMTTGRGELVTAGLLESESNAGELEFRWGGGGGREGGRGRGREGERERETGRERERGPYPEMIPVVGLVCVEVEVEEKGGATMLNDTCTTKTKYVHTCTLPNY